MFGCYPWETCPFLKEREERICGTEIVSGEGLEGEEGMKTVVRMPYMREE